MQTARKWAGRGLMGIGATCCVGTVALVAAFKQQPKKPLLPNTFILDLDLETTEVTEKANLDPLEKIGKALEAKSRGRPAPGFSISAHKLAHVLRIAAHDPRCVGIVARVGLDKISFPNIEEVRDGVMAFREADKPSVVWSENMEGTAKYLLMSAFETIAVQPTGTVTVGNLCAQGLFFRGLLDKVGVTAQVFHCGEYKSAGETFTEREHSSASREALDGVMGSLYDTMMDSMAQGRGMHLPWFLDAAGATPCEPYEALESRLVDELCYRSQARSIIEKLLDQGLRAHTRAHRGGSTEASPLAEESDDSDLPSALNEVETKLSQAAKAAKEAGSAHLVSLDKSLGSGVSNYLQGGGEGGEVTSESKVKYVSLEEYSKENSFMEAEEEKRNQKDKSPVVALVHLDGAIASGGKGQPGSASVGSFTTAMHAAASDPRVKAIVVRINSPGGDAVASDAMHAACIAAKKDRTIPVVASMGQYAASGGYFVACGCDRIVASPTTITGSIGVIAIQFNAQKLLERWGISADFVSRGSYAEWESGAALFKELPFEEERRILKRIDAVYLDFLFKVADGRGDALQTVAPVEGGGTTALSHVPRADLPTAMQHVAEGRVWAGKEAHQLGLVDSLGGIKEALMIAKEMGGIQEEACVVQYPKPKPPMESLLQGMGLKEKSPADRHGNGPWVVAPAAQVSVDALLLSMLTTEAMPGPNAAAALQAAVMQSSSTNQVTPMMISPMMRFQ